MGALSLAQGARIGAARSPDFSRGLAGAVGWLCVHGYPKDTLAVQGGPSRAKTMTKPACYGNAGVTQSNQVERVLAWSSPNGASASRAGRVGVQSGLGPAW